MYREINNPLQPTIEQFPIIEDTEAVTKQINRLFEPYVFFENHKKCKELWCSCCMKHWFMPMPPRTVTTVEYELMYNGHNEYVTCPYCGARAKYKNAKKLGKKKNLLKYHPVVLLDEKGGDLFARAYWTRKTYSKLDAAPEFYLVEAYHFTPGRATIYYDFDYTPKQRSISGNYDPVHRVITEPFTEGSSYWYRYTPYVVLGIEAIGRSSFKYCGYEEFEKGIEAVRGQEKCRMRCDMMKFFAAASIYPRQIEMLIKTGLGELVYDLVCGRKKNKDIFDWSKSNYLDAFGLTKPEMRAWRESGANMKCISWYKKLRRAGVPESFDALNYLSQALPYTVDANDFIRICCRMKLKPTKLFGYLCGGKLTVDDGEFQIYKDYVDMAQNLGWDLTDETVKFPRDLHKKHDEASEEINEKILRADLDKVNSELVKRMRKYNFEFGEYFIRCAVSANEIVREGKNLKHCVGGYAQRHMSGTLTILFLRRMDDPHQSLYTIEMQGNRLIQIHGYANDVGKAQPRDTMAWILEPWLNWIEKGSKRNEDGSPKLPGKRRTKTA